VLGILQSKYAQIMVN